MPDYQAIARQADRLRTELKLEHEPIRDIVAVLRQLGLKVVLKRLGRGPDGMYVRRGDVGFVLLNSTPYFPRVRFTAAHECGHHLLGHRVAVDENVFGKSRKDPQEQAANSFAAAFLVPEAALSARLPSTGFIQPGWVYDLATEFGVSYETVVFRLHNAQLLKGGYHQRNALMAKKITVVAESLDMSAPPDRTVLPPEYVRRAIGAYLDGGITLDRLAELIETDASELDRRFSEGAVEHDDETA